MLPIFILAASAFAADASQELTRRVYQIVQRHYYPSRGPFEVLSRGEPENLAAFWLLFREAFLRGRLTRGQKEILGAYISRLRGCAFCAGAHRTFFEVEPGQDPAALALLADEPAELSDPLLRDSALYLKRKLTRSGAVPELDARLRAELDGLVLVFGVANRVMDVLGQEWRDLTPDERAVLRQWRKAQPPEPGHESLLPASVAPDEEMGRILPAAAAGAWSQAREAAERSVAGALTPELRRHVVESAAAWDGLPPGAAIPLLRRADSLPPEQRQLGRFLIYVMVAPERLKRREQGLWVQPLERWTPAQLSAVVFWTAMVAARQDALRAP